MNKINLHIHSNYSLDGNLDINNIINQCIGSDISYISVTDHDNCDTYSKLDIDKLNSDVTLVYGVEADAIINNVTYDILCYGFELNNVRMWAQQQYGTISSRQTKIYNKLVEKCKELKLVLDDDIPYDAEKEFAHAAIFRMLGTTYDNQNFLNKYNIQNVNDFYRLSTMDSSFPLYIDMNIVWPTIDVLQKIIHDNGGKLFLAHPYKYAKGISVDKVLESCFPYIDGIEICNEPNNEEEVKYLYEYAITNNLLICAGSDFHGSESHNNLDVNYLNAEMEQRIINWIDKVPGKVKVLKNN